MILNPISTGKNIEISGVEKNLKLANGSVQAGDFISIEERFDVNKANYTLSHSGSLLGQESKKVLVVNNVTENNVFQYADFFVLERTQSAPGYIHIHYFHINSNFDVQLISSYDTGIIIQANGFDAIILEQSESYIRFAIFYDKYITSSSEQLGLRYSIINYDISSKAYSIIKTAVIYSYSSSSSVIRNDDIYVKAINVGDGKGNNYIFLAFKGSSAVKNVSAQTYLYQNGTLILQSSQSLVSISISSEMPSLDVAIIEANKVLIAFGEPLGSSYDNRVRLGCVVCTLNSGRMTVGSKYSLSSDVYTGAYIQAKTLSDGRVHITHVYYNSSDSYGYSLGSTFATVSGTTVSLTSRRLTTVQNSGLYEAKTIEMPGNRIYVFHCGASNYRLYCYSEVLNGSGKDAQIHDVAYGGLNPEAFKLTDDKIVVVHYGLTGRGTCVSIYNIDQISKFSSGVAFGVAKTDGRSGDTIVVYMPE